MVAPTDRNLDKARVVAGAEETRVPSSAVKEDELRLDVSTKHINWGPWSKKVMLAGTVVSTVLLIIGISFLAAGKWGEDETYAILAYDETANDAIHAAAHVDSRVHLPAKAMSVWYQVAIYTFAGLILLHQITLTKRMWENKTVFLNPGKFHMHLGAQNDTITFCVAALFFILFPIMHSQSEDNDLFVTATDYAVRNGNMTHTDTTTHTYNICPGSNPSCQCGAVNSTDECYASTTVDIDYITSNHKLGNGLIMIVVGIIICLITVPFARFLHDFHIRQKLYEHLPFVQVGRAVEEEKYISECALNANKTAALMKRRHPELYHAVLDGDDEKIGELLAAKNKRRM